MASCKVCGTPGQIIKVNRNLMARNEIITEELKSLKAELRKVKRELRTTSRHYEITIARLDRAHEVSKENSDEVFALRKSVADADNQLKRANSREEKLSRTISLMVEKLDHISTLSHNPYTKVRCGG